MTRGGDRQVSADELKLLIEAGNPIVSIETPDEPRAMALVSRVAEGLCLPIYLWSITEGLVELPAFHPS
jgi:hypothetical protein